MEFIREVFQAAKSFCSTERDLQKIIDFCEHAQPEFRSIAYEASSMQIALKDFEQNNSLQKWKHFADDLVKPHAAQVYAGLGWAVAQQSLSLDSIIESLPQLLRYRVADGCGYYDSTFRNRQTVRNKQLPAYVSLNMLPAYYQGVGRSLWYLSKGEAAKTNELLLSFDEKYHADLWRGVGIAVAYVGGSDDSTLKELITFSEKYLPQLACGVALAARSRIHAGCITNDVELCCKIICNTSAKEAANSTVQAESENYFLWLLTIEKYFSSTDNIYNKQSTQQFWDSLYQTNLMGWDLGIVSPPLKAYIDQLENKNLRILIPGCGNTYEAEYLLQKGFTNVTLIDIAPTLVNKLKNKFRENPNINIVLGDFFEHSGEYDLILEQTFFCAINPNLRTHYRDKMYALLSVNGKLAGLLFDKVFEKEGPPFGGSKEEYTQLFKTHFEFLVVDKCYNSVVPRMGNELFVVLKKNK